MTRPSLQHVYSQPSIDPDLEGSMVMEGNGRIVHAQRARVLRRRGVELWTAEKTSTGKQKYLWFTELSAAQRDALEESDLQNRERM